MSMARRVRGVAVMSLLWAVAWVLVWLPLVLYSLRGPRIQFDVVVDTTPLWEVLLPPAIWGAISGATFALFVAVLGSRRGWSALGVRHAVAWGALSGLVAPIGLVAISGSPRLYWSDSWPFLVIALLSAALNGALAAVTVALAKRGTSTASILET